MSDSLDSFTATVGGVIPDGGKVPMSVTGVSDCDGDLWQRSAAGHWHNPLYAEACDAEGCLGDKTGTMLNYAPLTVTAVREPQVGDLVKPGDPVSLGRVAAMRDDDGDRWVRGDYDPWRTDYDLWRIDWRDGGEPESMAGLLRHPDYWPMTIEKLIEPEPEPEPEAEQGPERTVPWGARLGLATTRQLLEELKARRITAAGGMDSQRLGDYAAALLNLLSPAALDYRTVERPAAPGPTVLKLPEMPKGDVRLVGLKTGRKYRPSTKYHQPDWWYYNTPDGAVSGYPFHQMLWEEQPEGVRVEPSEPRTWAKLDSPELDGVELPKLVSVRGWGTYGLREDDLYANTDGYPDDVFPGHCHTFASLCALGEVTEVFE